MWKSRIFELPEEGDLDKGAGPPHMGRLHNVFPQKPGPSVSQHLHNFFKFLFLFLLQTPKQIPINVIFLETSALSLSCLYPQWALQGIRSEDSISLEENWLSKATIY